MLPRERFGPAELLRWLKDTQDNNERASRSHAQRRAALRASSAIPPCTVVVILGLSDLWEEIELEHTLVVRTSYEDEGDE